jgi:uncharacterized membrane protein YccC
LIGPGLRDSLRLAATVAVVNGFTQVTGLPFAYYASMAVLSVSVGTYGNTLELGRQRLIGTTVGAIVVFFGYRAWGELPVVVALPLALLLARLIAGALRLSVGYSVCCFVVVMGWLSHDQQLDSWIPLRLMWTAFGILMALLSLRLFWPSQARVQQSQGLLQLLADLGRSLEAVPLRPSSQGRQEQVQQIRSLRTTLLRLREQRQGALLELGALAAQHPHARMWELLDQASEALILSLDELRRLPDPPWRQWGLEEIETSGLAFLEREGRRLCQWQEQLGASPRRLRPPPPEPRPELPLQLFHAPAVLAATQRLNPAQLQTLAAHLMVLSRIQQTLETSERQWLAIVS